MSCVSGKMKWLLLGISHRFSAVFLGGELGLCFPLVIFCKLLLQLVSRRAILNRFYFRESMFQC